ncbi:MAG: hypothetical protein GY856_47780, partial [bacterium]|nr:hypothetical protein [bacterium]
ELPAGDLARQAGVWEKRLEVRLDVAEALLVNLVARQSAALEAVGVAEAAEDVLDLGGHLEVVRERRLFGEDRCLHLRLASWLDPTILSASGERAGGAPARFRASARARRHMDGRGWCDIGYHFLADKLGNLFEGREGSLTGMPRGAHDGTNENSIGVSLMGYFHSPHNQQPTQVMRDAAYDVISWKVEDPYDGYGSGLYGSLSGIGYTAGHRDVSAVSESPEVSCSDGVDNDCDGLVDGDDPDCQTCLPTGASCTSNAECCS